MNRVAKKLEQLIAQDQQIPEILKVGNFNYKIDEVSASKYLSQHPNTICPIDISVCIIKLESRCFRCEIWEYVG